jgi:uncharacterized protein (DUF58 family)
VTAFPADPALRAPGVAITAEGLRALRRVASLPARRRRAAVGDAGPVVARVRGRGMEPIETRPFVDGDDPRRLDRHATARTGRPHVREHHDERALAILLVADFRPCMFWGTRGRLRAVAAAEALTILGWRRAEQGGRVGLLALTASGARAVRLRAAERGMEAVIGAMVAAHAQGLADAMAGAGDPPLDAALADAAALAPRGAEIALASCFEAPGAGAAALLGELAARGRLRPLFVTDAFEAAPPPGLYPVATSQGGAFWARFVRRAASPDPRATLLAPFGPIAVDPAASAEALAAELGASA